MGRRAARPRHGPVRVRVAGGFPVAHKIGWLETSRDDVAVVFTARGPVVVTVYAQGPIDATVYAFGEAAARAALARGRDR